jgi:S-disulfanyl-L-cysteine oxidoreductase SoxD
MRILCRVLLTAGLWTVCALAQMPDYKSVGRAPPPEEMGEWDISVGPAGKELPPGSGTVKAGAELYARKCQACHGENLEGRPASGNAIRVPALVGGQGTLTTSHIRRSIGSYWPFATTLYDFINRAMPPNQPMQFNPEEVYSLTAFLLYKNGIIQETDMIDAKSLPKIQMPNRSNFVPLTPVWDPKAVRPYGVYP